MVFQVHLDSSLYQSHKDNGIHSYCHPQIDTKRYFKKWNLSMDMNGMELQIAPLFVFVVWGVTWLWIDWLCCLGYFFYGLQVYLLIFIITYRKRTESICEVYFFYFENCFSGNLEAKYHNWYWHFKYGEKSLEN